MLESLCSLAFHVTDKKHPYEIAFISTSNQTKQRSTYIDVRNLSCLSNSSLTLTTFKNIPYPPNKQQLLAC